YGAPTRLLDWTDGALIALYFAVSDLKGCREADKEKKDRAVWVLDPTWLNENVVNDDTVLLWDFPVVAPYLPPLFESELSPEYPVALDPPHVARRVAVQRSRFTIHGTKKEGIEGIDSRAGSQSRLFKIIIANKGVPRIKKDLERCGITRTTLFPDLDSLGAELADGLATKAVRCATKTK
ncbi:MAG: FRG domain-containing protein, partial [Blastocatellia bacterium]